MLHFLVHDSVNDTLRCDHSNRNATEKPVNDVKNSRKANLLGRPKIMNELAVAEMCLGARVVGGGGGGTHGSNHHPV